MAPETFFAIIEDSFVRSGMIVSKNQVAIAVVTAACDSSLALGAILAARDTDLEKFLPQFCTPIEWRAHFLFVAKMFCSPSVDAVQRGRAETFFNHLLPALAANAANRAVIHAILKHHCGAALAREAEANGSGAVARLARQRNFAAKWATDYLVSLAMNAYEARLRRPGVAPN